MPRYVTDEEARIAGAQALARVAAGCRPGRDPLRIRRITSLIEALWVQVPDMRLGQLLVNYVNNFERQPFYAEDAQLEQDLLDILSAWQSR